MMFPPRRYPGYAPVLLIKIMHQRVDWTLHVQLYIHGSQYKSTTSTKWLKNIRPDKCLTNVRYTNDTREKCLA